MTTVYIDSEYKCHVEPAEGMREVEDSFFDGKCKAFIEGFRYVPEGETWIREDGADYPGLLIVADRDFSILEELQEQYEEMLSEAQARYEEGVNSI